MTLKPPTEIATSDLKAVREFLTSYREEERAARARARADESKGD